MISGADKEITIFSKEGKLFQIGKFNFLPLRICLQCSKEFWIYKYRSKRKRQRSSYYSKKDSSNHIRFIKIFSRINQ